ncbi:hypothetical protein QQ054_04135 [Oscillatoria amoena NRMC-F 0135]|nr:hypothetical protein [Oscillatoria amoena NRMC-F 0135]
MAGLDLGEILQIGSIAADVIKHRNNPLKFIESFFSSEEALQSYLEQIDQDIVQGFKNLVEELNEKNLPRRMVGYLCNAHTYSRPTKKLCHAIWCYLQGLRWKLLFGRRPR